MESVPPFKHTLADRGFETECWIDAGSATSGYGRRKRRAWFDLTVGVCRPGQVHQHLCEVRGEPNVCARPSHVVIGDHSTNSQHMHDLRRAAGEPWTGARRPGPVAKPYRSEPWTCHCGWVGTNHTASLHRIRKHGETGPVPTSLVD